MTGLKKHLGPSGKTEEKLVAMGRSEVRIMSICVCVLTCVVKGCRYLNRN